VLVTIPPELKLFEMLPKQIFFPSMSAFVSGFANAIDGKTSDRARTIETGAK
jgi:hypothetical protein